MADILLYSRTAGDCRTWETLEDALSCQKSEEFICFLGKYNEQSVRLRYLKSGMPRSVALRRSDMFRIRQSLDTNPSANRKAAQMVKRSGKNIT